MLTIQRLQFGFDGQYLTESLDLEVDSPCIVAVLGNNGRGKSTFFNVLRGKHPFIGQIKWLDRHIGSYGHQVCAYLGASYHFSFPFPVKDFILINSDQNHQAHQERFGYLVALFELEELLTKSITDLSQGQLQKVLILQTLMQPTPIYLLDEPESFLDIKNRAMLAKVLGLFCERYRVVVLFITHDLSLVESLAHQILNFTGDGIVLDVVSSKAIAKHRELLLK